MRSRREQLQAYRFASRRTVSALLSGEPETTELPLRRLGLSVFTGVMVAVLGLAGFGAWGAFTGTGAAWREGRETVLILEEETGARYVYRAGQLHPVLNYASARLALGAPEAPVREVSRAALTDIPRGRPVGIPGAPDSLPAPADLLGLPWTVCQGSDDGLPSAWLVIGGQPPGGRRPGPTGLLVTDGGTGRYLVWNDHRLRINDPVATLVAFDWVGARPLPVRPAFLNALPAGPDLAAPAVPLAGTPGARIGGRQYRVGQLFRVDQPEAPTRYYVLLADGLAPLSEVAYRLLVASGTLRAVYGHATPAAVRLTADDFRGTPISGADLEPDGLPATVPDLAAPRPRTARTVCAAYTGERDGRSAVRVTLFDTPPPPPDAVDGPEEGRDADGLAADRVVVPGGRGALIQSPGAATTYLVTDQGRKFPLADERARQALGFGGVRPVQVPGWLIAAVPTGPVLDTEAAGRYRSGG